jgi:secretion/DNA translocation related CpaE-like protein
MTDSASRRTTRRFSLGVVGASGGVGVSTLAAGLATRAALAGHEAAVLDLDRGGGGADLVLGCEREPGPRWADLAGASGQVDPELLLERLPRSEHGVAVLTGGRRWHPLPESSVAAVRTSLLGAVDVLVIDLARAVPPWITDLDAVLLVTGGTVSALAAAEVMTDRLLQAGAAPWLVTRHLEPRWEGAVSEALEVPVLARIPDDRRMADDLEVGRSPGSRSRSSFTRVCDELLRSVLIERAVA